MQLIMDVGMHTGKDTQFYIDKGFRVVAIEAHPGFVEENRRKFHRYIETGQLEIVPCAIGKTEGVVTFYVFPDDSDWGTSDPYFARRNISLGRAHQVIEVPSITFESVLQRFGVPYYLKIDIEGSDVLCVKALHHFPERPKYISLEAPEESFEKGFEALSHLFLLGYRRFKIINQALNHKQRCANPPREGQYVETVFDSYMSGQFGEESPGEWLGIEQTVVRYRSILRSLARSSSQGRRSRLFTRAYRHLSRRLGGSPVRWYDIHAAISRP
jgi:FkbM family methyltransferase